MPIPDRSSPENLRRLRRWLQVFAICMCLLLAAAGAVNAAQITVSYNTIQTQVRPRPGKWTTAVRVRITLHGGNQISDEIHSDNLAGNQRTGNRSGTFREKLGGVASWARTTWHIENEKTIVRDTDFDQQTQTIRIITTSDGACRAQVEYRLKPGFKEYKFISIRRGTPFYLSAIRVENISCQATP